MRASQSTGRFALTTFVKQRVCTFTEAEQFFRLLRLRNAKMPRIHG